MFPLSSRLENVQETYAALADKFRTYDFTLGGNWDYNGGCFDHHLDSANKVWLRVPFSVQRGAFDGPTGESDAVIRLGRPFVLSHLYKEGLDGEATPKIYASLIDQFQEPTDKDAEVDRQWVDKAKRVLERVEAGLLQ